MPVVELQIAPPPPQDTARAAYDHLPWRNTLLCSVLNMHWGEGAKNLCCVPEKLTVTKKTLISDEKKYFRQRV